MNVAITQLTSPFLTRFMLEAWNTFVLRKTEANMINKVMGTKISINLAAKDLNKSIRFFKTLGFSFNAQLRMTSPTFKN